MSIPKSKPESLLVSIKLSEINNEVKTELERRFETMSNKDLIMISLMNNDSLYLGQFVTEFNLPTSIVKFY